MPPNATHPCGCYSGFRPVCGGLLMVRNMLVLSICGVLCLTTAGREKGPAPEQDKTLRLKLEILKAPAANIQETKLKLTVTNMSKRDIVLDGELVLGVFLVIDTDLGDKAPTPPAAKDDEISVKPPDAAT